MISREFFFLYFCVISRIFLLILYILLTGEDRIFFNMSQRQSNNKFNNRKGSVGLNDQKHSVLFGGEFSANNSNHPGLVTSGSKHWITIAIPHNYIGSSWPIRVCFKNYVISKNIDFSQ